MHKFYPLSKLIYPLFLNDAETTGEQCNRADKRSTIFGSPRLARAALAEEISTLKKLGLSSFLIYVLCNKDQSASETDQLAKILDPHYFLYDALSTLTAAHPESFFVVDLCTCHFLSSGQCGTTKGTEIDNLSTLIFFKTMGPLLAASGIQAICLSSMMDGAVTTVRTALDKAGYHNTLIISQSAKIHSGFYGPFQSLSGGLSSVDVKKSYQLNPSNGKEMLRELELDSLEGADMVVLKPVSESLDLMVKVAHRFSTPILGYTTGGEYLMLNESLPKEPRARLDALNQYFTDLADTGMTAMISYFAQEYAQLRSQFAIK